MLEIFINSEKVMWMLKFRPQQLLTPILQALLPFSAGCWGLSVAAKQASAQAGDG